MCCCGGWAVQDRVCIPHSTAKPLSALDPMGPECPHIISKKLMKNFTSLTYNNGR